jgi:Zn-dependent protease with chaperone function
MVVAHELAHHAAGHMNFWVNLLMKPANLVPFLGSAYSRACELSADRIAASCIPQRREAAITAMICLASGSQMLTGQTSIAAFRAQEQQIPGGFGFVQEVLSSHPRMTKRIAAIEAFYDRQPHGAELASQAA